MATNFPTSLDSLTNPTSSDPLNNPSHAAQHADANDAIEALEAKVGINGSAVTTSHDYKIAQLETNSISKTVIDAKGDLIAGSAADTAARLAASTTNGQVLTVDTSTSTGLKWATPSDDIPKSLVDAKGDLLVGTANDTVGRLAVGSNGDVLVADSGATSGVRWQGQSNTGRNVLINGGFDVWQRGTSISHAASGYTADRFQQAVATAVPSGTISRQAFTAGSAPGSPYESPFFMQVNITANNGCTVYELGNLVEDVRTLAGQTVTFSLWAKADASVTIPVFIQQNFGSGGSSIVTSASQNISVTTSWQRFTLTYSLGSMSGKTIGTSSYLRCFVQLPVVSSVVRNGTYDFWGWQLEAGPVATQFEVLPYAETLRKCQRYYYRAGVNDVGDHFGSGFNKTTTVAMHFIPFHVPMRVAPTALEQTGTAANYSVAHANTSTAASSVPTFESATVNGASTNITVSSGLTAGQGSMARAANTAAYLAWSAEL